MNYFHVLLNISDYIFEAETELSYKLNIDDVAQFLFENNIVEVSSGSELANHLKSLNYNFNEPFIFRRLEFSESLIPDSIPISIIKAKVKAKGEIWDVHKNDDDYFPSSPHAHNYEQDLVMHLGNGKLYRKRKYVGKIKKKNLLKIRSLIVNVELPTLEIRT
jgi:hypothetical protein